MERFRYVFYAIKIIGLISIPDFVGANQPMCTARPGWQTISPQNMDYKKRMHQIRVNLVDILEINTHKM